MRSSPIGRASAAPDAWAGSGQARFERKDGADADDGVSYLELVDLLIRLGSNTPRDLEQLWRRIVFFICVSNTDDHLRNHGFMLGPNGWALAPAYDMNPNPHGEGLKLNISESDNAQDLRLALEVAPYFRLKAARAQEVVSEVLEATSSWRAVAQSHGLSGGQQDQVKRAFRVVESQAGSPSRGG